jgi:hypothetical protein
MCDATRAVVLSVIQQIDRGEVHFRRVGQVWEIDYRQPPARLPPPQPRILPATDYREWARCQTCGGHSFSSFRGLGGKVYQACDSCVGLPDRQMLGAPNL